MAAEESARAFTEWMQIFILHNVSAPYHFLNVSTSAVNRKRHWYRFSGFHRCSFSWFSTETQDSVRKQLNPAGCLNKAFCLCTQSSSDGPNCREPRTGSPPTMHRALLIWRHLIGPLRMTTRSAICNAGLSLGREDFVVVKLWYLGTIGPNTLKRGGGNVKQLHVVSKCPQTNKLSLFRQTQSTTSLP